MILIDALYAYQSGSKVLLDYLIAEFEKKDQTVFYLIDARVPSTSYSIKRNNKILFLDASFYKRLNFYRKHKNDFNKIFCFGNVPPPIKITAEVYTFLHQRIYLELPEDLPLLTKLSFIAKTRIVNLLRKNSDFWIVQNKNMQMKLFERLHIPQNNILVLPFYPAIQGNENVERNDLGFLYVSHPFLYKNHFRLIEAFCNFYDKTKKGKLTLTVDKSFTELYDFIAEKNKNNYPIHNIGFVKRQELYRYYKENQYLVFPSLSESFGLGIIEAIESGCNVIGADLSYTYEICEPSLVFDPNSTESMTEAFFMATDIKKVKPSVAKITDKMEMLLELLTE